MHSLQHFREMKDRFFGRDPHSPLIAEQQDEFEGLVYYEPNPDLRFEIRPEQFEEAQQITMQTSTGDVQDYIRWGRITFEVEGEEAQLTLYQAVGSGGFFLPFTDGTSGEETYSAGRYLEVEPSADGTLVVDFNMAYNPYCAYNPPIELFERIGQTPRMLYSCPIPPKENRLSVPIRAGERTPEGSWVQEDH